MPFTPEQHKAHRERMRRIGICIICRKRKARKGYAMCKTCTDRCAANLQYKVDNRLCRDCGIPLEENEGTKCRFCAVVQNEKRMERSRL